MQASEYLSPLLYPQKVTPSLPRLIRHEPGGVGLIPLAWGGSARAEILGFRSAPGLRNKGFGRRGLELQVQSEQEGLDVPIGSRWYRCVLRAREIRLSI